MQRGIRFNGRPVWAEIRLSALAHNIKSIRRYVNPAEGRAGSRPDRKILAVVKANAYGHGAVPVARALARAGVEAKLLSAFAERHSVDSRRLSGISA